MSLKRVEILFFLKLLLKNKLGEKVEIKWDNPKMILVAQDYNKYDKYMVNRIGYDIYLYKYIYYNNGDFYFQLFLHFYIDFYIKIFRTSNIKTQNKK